jgi:hypothetical protein
MNAIAEKISLIESLSLNQNATIQLLDKIIYHLIENQNKKLAELQSQLNGFEKKYSLSTIEFKKLFAAGEMGDDMDFFEWDCIADMASNLIHKAKSSYKSNE